MSAIALLLADQFADWECALLGAVARTHLQCDLTIATPDGLPVTSMGGLRVTPHARLEDLRPPHHDALVIAGGTSWESPSPPDIGEALGRFDAAGKVIAGICAGTVPLARAGLLNGCRHTSNSLQTLEVTGYRGRALYQDQPEACRDGTRVTAAGTAPVSFAAEVLDALGHESPDLYGFLALFGRERVAGRLRERPEQP